MSATAILLLGLISFAPQGGEPPPQGPDRPGGPTPAGPREAGEVPPGQLPPEPVDPAARSDLSDRELDEFGIGVFVEVAQDPPRLAPGEQGKLLLIVHVPPGKSRVEPGFKLDLANPQGPLSFGPPTVDPPPAGKGFYDDTFLIQLPVTVSPKAAKKPWPVKGSLALRGLFRPMDGPSLAEMKELHGHRFDFSKAVRSFAGAIKVGAPWPKPPKPALAPRGAGGGAAAGGTAGRPHAPRTAVSRPHAQPPAVRQGARGDLNLGGGEEPEHGGQGPGGTAPVESDEGSGRFVLGLLLAAAAAAGLLVLALRARS